MIISLVLSLEKSFSLGVVTKPASQVAQWQRIHLPMQETQETWFRSLGEEDPLG